MTRHPHAVPLLHDFLIHSARRRPCAIALVCDAKRYTYRDIDERSNALAHYLVRNGVEPGDRVLIFADNRAETVIAFWAALKANGVASVISPQTKADKLAYLLEDCRPSAFISESGLQPSFAVPVARSPHVRTTVISGPMTRGETVHLPGAIAWTDALASGSRRTPPARRAIDIDLASIIYTSGSTGEPKGVMHTHASMRAAATSISSYLEKREDDVVLNVLPMSFDYGLYQMIMAFRMGARLVLGRSFAFPAAVLKLMASERVTAFPGVPTMFAILSELRTLDRYDLSSVRYVTNTAAALPGKHIEMLQRTFPEARIYSMYGLTECKRVSYLPPEDLRRKPSSVGIAIPNTAIWIAGEDGKKLGAGEIGQIVVRGATVMRGYWEKPERTAEKLRPGDIPGELHLHTGDYGRLDEDGYLYFVGRMDDIIKSRGEKVAPKEVENALVNIPGVREAAVIGVDDAVLGQAIKAFVVLEEGASLTERDVQRECRKRIERFMVPQRIEIVPDLPKTSTGKINKTTLSEPASSQPRG